MDRNIEIFFQCINSLAEKGQKCTLYAYMLQETILKMTAARKFVIFFLNSEVAKLIERPSYLLLLVHSCFSSQLISAKFNFNSDSIFLNLVDKSV